MKSILIKITQTPLLAPECGEPLCADINCGQLPTFTQSGWIDDMAHGPYTDPLVFHSCVMHQKSCTNDLIGAMLTLMIEILKAEDEKGVDDH